MTFESTNRSIFWYAGMTVLIFFYIYQFNLGIIGLPLWLHSIRLASIALYLLFLFYVLPQKRLTIGKGIENKFYKKLINVHIFLFLYMLFLYFVIGVKEGSPMYIILINFFLFTIIPIYICCKLFRNWDEFLRVIMFATLLQSLFIWTSTLDPQIAMFYDLVFNEDIEEFGDLRAGYAGGIGCITAPGYIKYSIGQIACFYFAIKTHNPLYFLLYLFMLLTGAMVARTGLIAGGIGLILLVLQYIFKSNRKSVLSVSVLLIATLFIVIHFILPNNSVSAFFEERFARTEYMVSESKSSGFLSFGFFENYLRGETTEIPPLSAETMMGIGVPSGVAGNGIKVNVDGGFLRLYVAYGLIIAIFFYLFLFGNIARIAITQKNNVIRFTLLLTFIFFIVAEYKEWSVYGSPYVWFFTVLALLDSKQKVITSVKQV